MRIKKLISWINEPLDKYLGLRVQPSSEKRLTSVRNEVLTKFGIKSVLDVGANSGQYATKIRKSGFQGQIDSFEPTTIFNTLKKNAAKDGFWNVHNLGLSDFAGEATMNISSNSGLSSSILNPKEILNQGFGIAFNKTEKVKLATLDSFLAEQNIKNGYLKIDAQGAEMKVLLGADKELSRITAIEFESALVDLYQGETHHYEIANWLISRGFSAVQVAPTHWTASGKTISLDAIFVRKGNS